MTKKRWLIIAICLRVITLQPSRQLKVTLVHWEGLMESRDPDAPLPCVKAALVAWSTKNNKASFSEI